MSFTPSKELLADKQRGQAIRHLALEAMHKELHDFMIADNELNQTEDFNVMDNYLSKVASETKVLALARYAIDDIAHITEQLNNVLDKNKPMFGKVSKGNYAKAEVVRGLAVARYLQIVIEQINAESDTDNKGGNK